MNPVSSTLNIAPSAVEGGGVIVATTIATTRIVASEKTFAVAVTLELFFLLLLRCTSQCQARILRTKEYSSLDWSSDTEKNT